MESKKKEAKMLLQFFAFWLIIAIPVGGWVLPYEPTVEQKLVAVVGCTLGVSLMSLLSVSVIAAFYEDDER